MLEYDQLIKVARQARACWLAHGTHSPDFVSFVAYGDVLCWLLERSINPDLATGGQWMTAVRETYTAIEQRLEASINRLVYAD